MNVVDLLFVRCVFMIRRYMRFLEIGVDLFYNLHRSKSTLSCVKKFKILLMKVD